MAKCFIITNHAISRYKERMGLVDMSDGHARQTIIMLLHGAKPHKARAAKRVTKKTAIVPTSDGYFIASAGKIVSFVKVLRQHTQAVG